MLSLGQGPAAKAAVHKGAMSEPVRRAHRVKIHEPPSRRGIFSRMSSTDSHHMGAAPCVKADSFDSETSTQASCPDCPAADRQNSIQEELENEPNESPVLSCAEQETGQAFAPEQPEKCEELSEESQLDKVTEPEITPETQCQTNSLPQPQPVPHPQLQTEAKSSPLIPPSSPPRVRRTLEAPTYPLPSTPVRTKGHSRSCPRKQTTSTPLMNRRSAFQWQTQQARHRGNYGSQVRPIPNGLCMSDSTASSSDVSSDSLEFVPSRGTAEQCEGTLQREMKALFDQRMEEIRCKSPLFLNSESPMM